MLTNGPFSNRIAYLLGFVVLFLAMILIGFQLYFPSPALPKIRVLPDFKLTERMGSERQLSDLKGKVWLADLVYTTCPSTCPMLSHRFSGLQAEAFKNPAVRFVSISVNPSHDTPEVLRAYADQFHADSGKWWFLTGDKEKVQTFLETGLQLGSKASPENGTEFLHSTKIVLVDKNGVIRAYYEGVEGDVNALILRDIRRLLKE